MKRLLNRRAKQASDEPADAVAQEHVDDGGAEYVGGWSTGGRANTSALLRWTVWGLIVLGPVLGGAAFLSKAAAGTTRPTAPASPPSGTGSQGAAGFATLFVADYLRAGEGDQEKLAAYYPAAGEMRLEGDPNRRHGEQLTVVRVRQTAPEVWSVTVAARITATTPAPTATRAADGQDAKDAADDAAAADAIRYFQVPVAVGSTSGGASGFIALALPAEVAAPARIKPPQLVYGPLQPAVPSDPRTQAVTQFLSAYLTGSGELDRYLAPGTKLAPIRPAPYTGIAVDQLSIEGDQGSEPITTVPGDGSRLRLMVTLRATGRDEVRVPLTYALALKARAGRWEIAGLDGAPSPLPPAPAAATSPGPAPTS
ncbi:conjugal transfer protein [Streptomyces umbrinus]